MPPPPHGRRVALLGRSMVRNMTIAADLGYLKVPEGVLIDYKKAARPARRQDRLHVDGLAGRADGRAQPHGEQRPPDRARRGRHRHPRVEPHPRQRERRLPRDRRPHQARRERRAQGQRQGARLGPRRRGRAALLLQHPEAEERAARCTASTGTSWPTRSSRRTPASRAERTIIGENGTVDRPAATASRASSASSTSASSTSTARRSARSPTPTSRTAGSSARRASSRSSSSSTPPPAGSSSAPRSTPAASPRTTRCSTSVKPKIAAALAEAAQNGVRDTHALSQVVRRTIGRWVNQQLRRRPMIVPLVIEA